MPKKNSVPGDGGLDLPDDEAARRHAQSLARGLGGMRGPFAERLRRLFVRARRNDGSEVTRVPIDGDDPDEREH